jgi:parallel beta-helix repeat protein
MRERQILMGTAFGLGLALLLLALLGRAPEPAHASPEIRYVSPAGLDSGDCTLTPCQTIQYAVDVAAEDDVILVRYGIYSDRHTYGNYTQVVYISKTLTIRGGYSDGFSAQDVDEFPTMLDGGAQGRVMAIVGNVSPTLEALWVTNGNPGLGKSGGGIYALDAHPIVSNCRIFSNTAVYGGGVQFRFGDGAVLVGSRVYDNEVFYNGGGVSLWSSNDVLLSDNAIFSNTAGHSGGGIAVYESDHANLTSSQVYSNSAVQGGGGIQAWGSDELFLTGNEIYTNTAGQRGGGLYLGAATAAAHAHLTDNAIHDNAAENGGAAYLLFADDAALSGNQIYANTAITSGGGLFLWYSDDATLTGNQIEHNTCKDEDGGGVHLLSSDGVTLTGNAIGWNTAQRSGGGIYLNGSEDAALIANTVYSNTAGYGGGLYLYGQSHLTLTLVNNLIADNYAISHGPGIYLKGVVGRLLHTTVARNTGGDGVGVYVTSGSAVLTNTILVGHGTGVRTTEDSSASLEATLWGDGVWENCLDWDGVVVTGTLNLWEDPRFANPDRGNYHLRSNSPAVDEGLDAGVPDDIDGDPRTSGEGPDLGADESTCLARADTVDYPTVQGAVDAVTPGGTVLVAEGVCYENVAVTKTLALEGGWSTDFSARHADPASFTTIDGAQGGRVISVTEVSGSVAVTVDGFTITGGDATGLGGCALGPFDIGGGIYGWYADVSVSDCVVRDNLASSVGIGWGGGLGFYGGDVTLVDNVVEHNTASATNNGYGGGAYCRRGTATLRGNTLRDNAASDGWDGWGGGVAFYETSSADLEGNAIQGNTGTTAPSRVGHGGGVVIYASTATLDGDRVEGNRAETSPDSDDYGGGIWSDQNSNVTLTGIEVVSNTATFGGGVYVSNARSAAIIDSAIYSNTAGMGGGLVLGLVPGATLIGTAIHHNSAGYAAGGWLSACDDAVVTDNEIHHNWSIGLAGGLWLTGGEDTLLARNWIHNNEADEDGGGLMFINAINHTLENNVIADNAIDGGEGAGVRLDNSTVRLLHTTLARNVGGDGSGLHLTTSSVALTNTILVSHSVGISVASGSSAVLEATLWGDGTWANGMRWGGAGTIDPGSIGIDGAPGFLDPDDGNYHIRAGSEAIDAGIDAGVGDDVDGDSRPLGTGCDIGADEARFVYLPLVLRDA